MPLNAPLTSTAFSQQPLGRTLSRQTFKRGICNDALLGGDAALAAWRMAAGAGTARKTRNACWRGPQASLCLLQALLLAPASLHTNTAARYTRPFCAITMTSAGADNLDIVSASGKSGREGRAGRGVEAENSAKGIWRAAEGEAWKNIGEEPAQEYQEGYSATSGRK